VNNDDRVMITTLALCVLGLALFCVDSCGRASAAAVPPRPRLARQLTGAQIARAVTNAPPGARVSVPLDGLRGWAPHVPVSAGDTCSVSGAVYVCVQSHTPLPGWQPPAVPALWRLVRAATDVPGLPPAWRQPQGAHDAYRKGDRVTHGGKVWTTAIDYNVWAPGVYGWVPD
jgi:hypothetical protein